MPKIMAKVVIKIGRSRIWAASNKASCLDSGCWGARSVESFWGSLARIAKSMSKIAFLVTKPINITMPMTEKRDMEERKSSKASTTPIKVRGKEDMMAKGCKKLLN